MCSPEPGAPGELSRKRKSAGSDSDSESGQVKKFAMADFGFEYLDHPADIQLHAWGRTMEKAMEQLVQSMYGYLIDDPKLESVEETYEYYFEANGDDMQSLVFALLNEPLVSFQSEPFFIGKRVVIDSIDFEKFNVQYHAYGESYEIDKHKQGTDVKAITYSNMQITCNDDRSDLYVIIDI